MESILKLYGPEGVYTEYKERLPSPKVLAKTLVSLSNTKGGRIIIGVEDKTGNVVGLETTIDIEEYIMNVASENCEPIISPIVEMRSYGEKLVVVVDVPYGPLRPYHLRRMPIHESAYVRIGSTNRLADAPSIQQLMREAVHESFDRLLVPKTASRDLDWMKISQYQELKHKRLGTIKEKISDSFAKKIGIKRHTSPSSPVTVGGLLLFGRAGLKSGQNRRFEAGQGSTDNAKRVGMRRAVRIAAGTIQRVRRLRAHRETAPTRTRRQAA